MNEKTYVKTFVIVFFDMLFLFFSGLISLWIRFEFSINSIPDNYVEEYLRVSPIFIATFIILYIIFKLYRIVWRFASVFELIKIIYAYAVAIPLMIGEIYLFHMNLPRSVYLMIYMLNFAFCVLLRFSFRIYKYLNGRHTSKKTDSEQVMVIGAGSAARTLIADISTSNKVHYHIACIIDDNKGVHGKYIGSIPIVGGRESIEEMAGRYRIDRIIFAIPSIPGKQRAEILNICQQTGCKVQAIPGMYQLVNEEVSVSRLRDVDVVDLLGRDEIHVDNNAIFRELKDKVVLVTGGGGSIGSELCRQIAAASPKQLIIFDIYENNAYEIQNELMRRYPSLNLITLIGSVRNTNRVNLLLSTYKPDYVYHAAAHKHVPLMEDSPNEAIKNNCLGTLKMARASAEHGVKRFLLISTDKAVNPTNVMGASKRICELIIQVLDRKYKDTTFCAVRFGNVLGSNGSVIPLFKEQISVGGPVTVTDKDIIRYFMTIPEAVSLVLQSSFYADGGEIFVLDMGEPVRIDDMARRMIELSGFKPDIDIEVKYTGLRPGEKLYEELLIDKKRMKKTDNNLIFIEEPYPMDDAKFMEELTELETCAKDERDDIRTLIKKMVPTYHTS